MSAHSNSPSEVNSGSDSMDEAVDITAQRMGYPSDEYLQLMHQVTQLRSMHHAICSFQQCISTLHDMLMRQGIR